MVSVSVAYTVTSAPAAVRVRLELAGLGGESRLRTNPTPAFSPPRLADL
jgi:hypothetical protein